MLIILDLRKQFGYGALRIEQILNGMPQNKAALAQKVSDRTARELIQNYKECGWDGLKDRELPRVSPAGSTRGVTMLTA